MQFKKDKSLKLINCQILIHEIKLRLKLKIFNL